MRRRKFIAGLGCVAAWPLAARGQTSVRRPVIAVMSLVARERNIRMLDAFMQGLRELEFFEGRDFAFALRSADGHLDRTTLLAQEVFDLRPDVILATATPAVVSLAALTKTLPIVCPLLADPTLGGPMESTMASSCSSTSRFPVGKSISTRRSMR